MFHTCSLNLKTSTPYLSFSLDAFWRVNDEKYFQEENRSIDKCEHCAWYEHIHVLFAGIEFVVAVVRAENLSPIIDNYASSDDVQEPTDWGEQYQLQSEQIDVTQKCIEIDDLLLLPFFKDNNHKHRERAQFVTSNIVPF